MVYTVVISPLMLTLDVEFCLNLESCCGARSCGCQLAFSPQHTRAHMHVRPPSPSICLVGDGPQEHTHEAQQDNGTEPRLRHGTR
jgi:hypothetical protein